MTSKQNPKGNTMTEPQQIINGQPVWEPGEVVGWREGDWDCEGVILAGYIPGEPEVRIMHTLRHLEEHTEAWATEVTRPATDLFAIGG